MDIRGHAALVTGGGSGLGAATARMLAQAGAKVALLDVNQKVAAETAIDINGIAIHCDVADSASTEAAIAKAAADHGPARILINCAGIGTAKRIVGRDGPMALADFERVVRVNLIGTFNAMRLAAAAMAKLDPLTDDERGIIVCTASVAAYDGQIGQAAYASSKGGVVALVLPAAREFAQFGIRVNAIAPGIFDTPMLQGLSEPARESLCGFAAVPEKARRPGAVRRPGAPHDREPLPQRRGRPPRRLAAHGAEINLTLPPCRRGSWGHALASALSRRLPTPLPTLPHKGGGNRSRHVDQHPKHAHRMVPLRSPRDHLLSALL